MATIQMTSVRPGAELSRLLTAAVVNRGFRDMLLKSPANALEKGYNGEAFALGQREKEWILSIRAGSLPEFARQLSYLQGQPANRRERIR